MYFLQYPQKNGHAAYFSIACSLLTNTSWRWFQISKCGVCTSGHSIH